MKLLTKLTVVALAYTILVACGEGNDPVTLEPVDNRVEGSANEKQSIPAPLDIGVDSLSRVFATDAYNTQSGELVGEQLVNEGREGYLLFGPYIAFQPGAYNAQFSGEVLTLPSNSKVRLDVASEKGRTVHGRVDTDSTGPLPTLQFKLDEPVEDLELRVLAPDGSMVALQSYEISRTK